MCFPAQNTEIVLCACIVTWFSALSWTENQNERWYLASEGINKKLLRNSQIMSLPVLHEEHSCSPYTAWLTPMLLSLLALNPLQWIYLLCATVTSLTCFELHSGCTILSFRSLKFAFFFFLLNLLHYCCSFFFISTHISHFTRHESENYFLFFPYQRHFCSQAIFHLPHFHLNKTVFTERVYTSLSTTQG